MALLTWNGGNGARTHSLEALTLIGRSAESDVVLADERVSKTHARITGVGDQWLFEDMGSTNGSLVNGEPGTSAVLSDGDVIGIGHVEITFQAGTSGRQAPAAQAQARLHELRDTSTTSIGELLPRERAVSRVSSVRARGADIEGDHDPAALSRRLKVCYEISEATAATLDLPQILDRVLSVLFDTFSAAEKAFVLLVEPGTDRVTAAATKNRTKGDTVEMSVSRTVIEQAMQDLESVLCVDAASDGRYASSESIITLGIRSLMVAPLVFQDDVLGAIHVDSRHAQDQFTHADLELLTAAASQVAACVANALLHEQFLVAERLAAVGQTVAGLTHCIKNILQGIKGGAYIVDKSLENGDDEKLAAGWEMVRRNNAFMEALVFDLLTLSKGREPELEESDLNALCELVCELGALRGEAKGVPVAFNGDRSLPPVEVDPKGIRRSILNLVTNAVDACAKTGGNVSVGTIAPDEDGFARILVADTGCGMSAENKGKLFTVFFSTKGS